VLLWNTNPPHMICLCSVFLGEEQGLQPDKHQEDHAIDNIANITDDVVEIIKDPPRPRTAIVEEALLQVPCSLGSLLLCKDHLARGNEVEQGEKRDKVPEGFRPLPPVPDIVPDHYAQVLQHQLVCQQSVDCKS